MNRADLAVQISEGAISAVGLPLRRTPVLEGVTEDGQGYTACSIIHDVDGGNILGSFRIFNDGKIKIHSPRGLEGLNQVFAARVQIGLIAARHKFARVPTVERELLDTEDK